MIATTEFKARINKVQKKIENEKLDCLIVSEEEDIYYLTGLTYKSLERLFLLVIKKNGVTFILPKMELAHLEKVDNVDEIKCYWEYPAQSPERWQDILIEVIGKDLSVGVGGKSPFEIADFLRAQDKSIRQSPIVEELRWIKSPQEIKQIELACHYCDSAIKTLNDNAYYGMSELEVFSIGKQIQQLLIKETEFDYLASNVLVAAWPGRISDQPHGNPKVHDVLIEGSHISLAFLRVNGYAAELERTFFTHKPGKDHRDMFALMMEARKRCYDALKPGITCEEVDFAAKHFLESKGLGENLMHRTGHGIGLGNHEGPFLAEGDSTVLKENMVVSIEPGIYIKGIGGFRHSDTVQVTKDGFEILTHCPDDIESLTFTKSRPLQWAKGKLIKKMFKLK